MIKDLITVSELVEEVLATNHNARNSDKELISCILGRYNFTMTGEQLAIWNKLPAFESITRARRKIQAEGKYQADPEVLVSRKYEEKLMRKGGYSVSQMYKTPKQLGLPVDNF